MENYLRPVQRGEDDELQLTCTSVNFIGTSQLGFAVNLRRQL